ncbi:MAG: hypothetical protein QNL68_18855 [Akkermansiaceae bacterium]
MSRGVGLSQRLYALRLEQIRSSEECRKILKGLDEEGLLEGEGRENALEVFGDDEELLAALGVGTDDESDITKLTHVKTRTEIRAAEEVETMIGNPECNEWCRNGYCSLECFDFPEFGGWGSLGMEWSGVVRWRGGVRRAVLCCDAR